MVAADVANIRATSDVGRVLGAKGAWILRHRGSPHVRSIALEAAEVQGGA